MLSGLGNENDEKTTRGLISKIATLHVQHTFFCTFFCRCFERLQRETSKNCLTFYGGNVARVREFFFHCRSFPP